MALNRALLTTVTSMGTAQLLKIFTPYLENKEMKLTNIRKAGGMPSSHSSGVTALATYVGLEQGFHSTQFSIAAVLGLIVMYDAAGIRRHAGQTAVQVNDLDVDVEQLAGHHPGTYHTRRSKKLKERLGHQPVEVLAGALLGIGIGIMSYYLRRSS